MSFQLDPAKFAELQDRWSDISPDAGTEECICMVCAKMIGTCEEDPRWEEHDEFCIGCEICDSPIRLFKEGVVLSADLPAQVTTLEMRFHPKCFEGLLAKRS